MGASADFSTRRPTPGELQRDLATGSVEPELQIHAADAADRMSRNEAQAKWRGTTAAIAWRGERN